MKKIKRIIQEILLYLLKKLNMPTPFKYFSKSDMVLIYKELVDTVEKLSGVTELYYLPSVVYDSESITPAKNDDYGTLQFNGTNGEKASVNVRNDYEVFIIGLDDDTSALVVKIVKKYLKRNKFI